MSSAVEQDARLERALRAIDLANGEDPRMVMVRATRRPKALAESELATEWVHRLDDDPSTSLRLAARGHHLRRWQWPRASYPAGRAGYLRWRRDLHDRHASELAAILVTAGYDAAAIARVQDLVRKRGLGQDPEVQVLEDALCLVFLELDLAPLMARTDSAKMAAIVEKTLLKMSEPAVGLVASVPGAADQLRILGLP